MTSGGRRNDRPCRSPASIPDRSTELPAAFDLKAAERGRAWGMETDELDVPYIVRYGVGAGGGPG